MWPLVDLLSQGTEHTPPCPWIAVGAPAVPVPLLEYPLETMCPYDEAACVIDQHYDLGIVV